MRRAAEGLHVVVRAHADPADHPGPLLIARMRTLRPTEVRELARDLGLAWH